MVYWVVKFRICIYGLWFFESIHIILKMDPSEVLLQINLKLIKNELLAIIDSDANQVQSISQSSL